MQLISFDRNRSPPEVRHCWPWRAVDNEGKVLDFLVQSRRCKAAGKLLKRRLAPTLIVADKLRS